MRDWQTYLGYRVHRSRRQHRVRVGAESRTSAEKLCANLRAAGASCEVQRN